MAQSGKNYKRICIKVGSSLFCSKSGGFDQPSFNNFVSQISVLAKDKSKSRQIVIVSSGAIALGMYVLGYKSRPKELSYLQAAAAVGQNILMDKYAQAFTQCKINIPKAQVLLTRDDFNDRTRYLNAKNTLCTLFKLGAIPIVNENDTVSTEEIKFGDNDQLSALVATMISADLLILVSDVDGLLDREHNLIRVVGEITGQIRALACPSDKLTSVGGMITKIEAAKIAVGSGIPCVIANGRVPKRICAIAEDPFNVDASVGNDWTVFLPKKRLGERERWIAFGTRPQAAIFVDEGAKKALRDKKSLLSVGVIGTKNYFEAGDVVSLYDKAGREFARGKVAVSGRKLEEVKGSRFEKEIIHRDNIVILE